MALRIWLAGVAVLLLEGPPALGGSSTHSLRYFYTAVSEPNQGLPQFVTVGYVDDQLFSQYDSVTRREQPRAPWIKRVGRDDPQYWDRNTQVSWAAEQVFRANLETARNYYNQSRGFHSVQWMYGCELRPDGSTGGSSQFAYDGRDYISFDKETLTWTAAYLPALNTKRKWEGIPGFAQRWKAYLEGTCVEWLRRYLDYGKERLLRTEPPVGKVTRTLVLEGREMLVCHVYGFYPKEIEATWRKGREVVEEGTFRRNVAPNPDGTFHAWLSIEINPEEREVYRCHIEHAGLREPLVLGWEAPGDGSSTHSLRYFYTAVSEPSQGLPQFITVGYVDDQLFSQYDSITRREQPRAPWIKRVDRDDPQYWDRNTQVSGAAEQVFRANLEAARNYYNQSRGFHSVQWMYGCELRPDGSTGGSSQFAYDGRDYISFDKETLTWTAADLPALNTKRKWEGIPGFAQRWKAYLEGTCVEWLRRYLDYGKERLLRTEPPVGKVTRTLVLEGREMLVCHVYGFYPKEIEATWRKGREVVEEGTFWRNVAPNPDGTFHAWLSIEINPEEREVYRCHIEHAGLREPLVLGWEAPGDGSSTHSLRYFYTAVSEPSQGLPQFITVGYVDDQLFSQYDSITRREQPRAPWIKRVDRDDPQYWDRNTQVSGAAEQVFRANLETARNYYNQSRGFHSVQWMYGCELRPDGSTGGSSQFAYDGRDYISFDKETLTWTAADPTAQITRRKWDYNLAYSQHVKAYLEGTCVEWLRRYLDYGKERLLRTEPPVGKVTGMLVSEGREMLVCQAHGFHPKEIKTTWRKDGEVVEEETFRRNVAPNSDGTYHAWLSIEIDPEEKELYRCHIEHTGLTEPLVLAWEAPGVKMLQPSKAPLPKTQLRRRKYLFPWLEAILCTVLCQRGLL